MLIIIEKLHTEGPRGDLFNRFELMELTFSSYLTRDHAVQLSILVKSVAHAVASKIGEVLALSNLVIRASEKAPPSGGYLDM